MKFCFPVYEGQVIATILTLNENTLKLSLPIEEDDGIDASPKYRGDTVTKSV